MNPQPPHDPLDELLAAQPVKPSPGFAERILARLQKAEDEELDSAFPDDELDAMLQDQPIRPSADFADRVMAQLEPAVGIHESEEDKVVGFPSWVIAMGSIAALMVLGMFSFITLFNYAETQKEDHRTVAQQTTTPAMDSVSSSGTSEVPVSVASQEGLATGEMTMLPGLVEYETVLTLDETLDDALILADLETLNTLQAFLN